ncbi:putative efflux protein, MATE family [Mariniphaga anaerophila]|uniref:Multidrug export protein MepA n=1 Tax=Mariniphaga anaerophila TaxID=1484053 RepID=A0A1M4T8Z0_9BACT|nr:MATE family efflux transporter [Mariniphaga anaerophila]SHE40956.1 putative efflux protein, MATE family [Mariniphaga anaerophila]
MEQNKSTVALGTENVWRLLLQYAIPSVIAMTATSLYNITDSVFIGQGVGALAISGLAITFPLMNLGAAFGSLVGVGASTLMSLRLGQKDYATANRILGNVFVLNLVLGVLYSVIVLTFLDPILYFFGASKDTISYAHDYMVIISLGNIVTHMYLGLNALLRAIGEPRKAMTTTILSVVINAILTPIFIYVMNLGIRGAAIATVLAQTSMLIWQIKIFSNKNNLVHLKRDTFSLKRRIVLDSLAIGISPFSMNVAASVIVIIINQSLTQHGGDLAVGAFGIINRVIFLFVMVVLGLNQGMQPIAGYNYGARQNERVTKVLTHTIFLATGVMLVGFIVGEFFPRTVASIFTREKELIDIAVTGLRIVFISTPIIGFQMVASNFFQSIGKPGKAIYLSLTRQVLFLLPCLLIFPSLFGVKGVWMSMPTSDILASLNAGYLLFIEYRKNKISK